MWRFRVLPAVFAFAASFVLVVASSVARAQGDDDRDGVIDEVEESTERSVVWAAVPEFEPSALSISSRSVSAPEDDLFRVTFEAGQFEVEYVRQLEEGHVTSAYRLALWRVLEWADQDGDGQFEPDEAVFEDGPFPEARVNATSMRNPDGGQVSVFSIIVGPTFRSQVIFTLTIAQRFMRLTSDRVLTPMELKLDIVVNHFFENPGSRLVLAFSLQTHIENRIDLGTETWDAKHGFSKDESWVSVKGDISSESSGVFFSWKNYATTDGKAGAVPSVVIEGPAAGYESKPEERYFTIYMVYPVGPDPNRVLVIHDPAVGVVSAAYEGIVSQPGEPRLQADIPLYALSLALMAILVAASVILVNRWRRPKP